MSARPRVVVVGAGMAGLSAAHRLHRAWGHALDLMILEGSNRVGGRIHTAHLGGNQVELGATYIHGITGSPIHNIAQRIGALSAETPWELCDDKPAYPVIRAQGAHLPIDLHLVSPAMELYRSSMALVKDGVVGHPSPISDLSVGAFLGRRLRAFLSEQETTQSRGIDACEGREFSSSKEGNDDIEGRVDGKVCSMWNQWLLQESAYLSLEAKERCISACDSLHDLDLASLKEYTEYPGPHVTIAKGYASVLKELENSLPPGTVKLGKKVQKVFWNHSHPSGVVPVVLQCEDGSVVEAEHVILTMSLGVLKAGVSKSLSAKHSPSVSRSVQDLRGWETSDEVCAGELFEPSLPSWKLDAISRLGFGVVDKLFLLLDPAADKRLRDTIAFLHHKELEGVPRWLKRAHSMFPIYEGSDVVLCWLAGAEALEMEGLSDSEVLDGMVQMLSSFELADPDGKMCLDRNNSEGLTLELSQRKMFRGLLRSKWGTNPLCQGSYSFVAVGSSGEDIDILAKPLPDRMLNLSEPSGEVRKGDSVACELPTDGGFGCNPQLSPLQLLFAGEATHRSFYSTTHGAFLSGVREADRLLKHYQIGSQSS
eukprot:c23935_g1_i1 orf=440-2227(-)